MCFGTAIEQDVMYDVMLDVLHSTALHHHDTT